MASRSAQAYRGEREDDGWVRPYNPSQEVRDWSTRPHAQRGQENYGYEVDHDARYDQYYNRPYYISGINGDSRASRYSESYRHVPISKSNPRRCLYWALTLLSALAVLLLVALAVFVVIYVLDLQRNKTTTSTMAPIPGITTQAPPGVKVNAAMKLNQPFLPAYNNPQSQEYMDLAASVVASMDTVFLTSDLRDSYINAVVNGFTNGSVDVNVTITFNQLIMSLTPTADPNGSGSMESRIALKVTVTITTAIDNNVCCQGLDVDVNSVTVTRVTIDTSATSAPSVQPPTPTPEVPAVTTAVPPTAVPPTAVPSTQMPEPVVTTAEDVPPTPTPVVPVQTTPAKPAASTTEAPAPTTTHKETTAVVAMTTEAELATTSSLTTTSVVTFTERVTPNRPIPSATTGMIMTTDSVEISTENMTTPCVLNPAECGLSSQAPPDSIPTPRGTWPWVGSIRYRTGHACGVTLLSQEWAVTSVTCLGISNVLTSLVFGDTTSSYSQSDVHVEREIERFYPHPGYNPATYDNDIAFIKMTQPVPFSEDVKPVCVAEQGSFASTYGTCYIAGWGSLTGSSQENLQTATASTIIDGPCIEADLPVRLTDKFICAEFSNADACIGDYGSGLMCQNTTTGAWTLVGLADWAADDCRKASFAKVSNYFDVACSVVTGAPEYQCDPIEVSQCTSALSYSSTYPTTQSAVTDIMNAAESFGLGCHGLVSTVLCTVMQPECRANGTGLILCRQTCDEVSSDCASLFNSLALELDCALYPAGLTNESGLCESGEDYSCGNHSVSLPSLFSYEFLSSPNYPNPYPAIVDCVWIVTAPQDSHVVVRFLSLNIEACCDTLSVGEGTDVEDRTSIHRQLYGSTLPLPEVIRSSVVWLRLQSDYQNQEQGFQAEVQAVGNTGLASLCPDVSSFQCTDGVNCIPYRWRCDNIQDCILNKDESCRVIVQEFFLEDDGYQQITSPGYSALGYPRYASFTYLLSTLAGRKLLINWIGFSTENGYDILEIGDGLDPDDKSTLFFRWSGSETPPTLLSNGNEMWILFTSDNLYNDLGFDLDLFDVNGSESFDCQNDQFDCGHSVCIPYYYQCDGMALCVNGTDEEGCVTMTFTGSMILLVPFTSELENSSSALFLELRRNFTRAIDAALESGLGAEYIYDYAIVDSFKSSDDPTVREASTPDTFVEFTIQLIHLPPASPVSDVQQVILAVLATEASNGSFGSIPVNASSVVIYDEPEIEVTTPVIPIGPPLCASEEFECDSGRCLPAESVCNQIVDCSDGTDEVAMIPLCRIACGPADVNLTTQASVQLTVPMLPSDTESFNRHSCGYIVTAPPGYRIRVVFHRARLLSGYQTLILTFGDGQVFQTQTSLDQTLDFISQSHLLHIAYFGYIGLDAYGIDFELSATNDTDFDTCDNGLQILPAERRCDQSLDCLDFSDEFGCQPQCGQSNYTLPPSGMVPLQLTDYPADYPNNTACLWSITGVANASIIFRLDDLDLAAGDELSFGRGHDPSVPLSKTAEVPGILPNGSYIVVGDSQAWVLFLSNAMETGRGFRASMQVLYDNDAGFMHCDNLVQVVPADKLCDGMADCIGDPTDESDCEGTCQAIPIDSCLQLLPYNTTQIPNRFAANVASAMNQYQQASADHFCQSQSELVICSLLFPECPTGDLSGRRAVCRSVCEGAVQDCNFNDGICDSLPQTGGDMWCNYDNDILETGICGTAPAGPNSFTRIVGGEDASLGEWPWMLAVLDENYQHQCGATLISDKWAITAAHCADVTMWILAGVRDLTNLGSHYELIKVKQVFVHQLYQPDSVYDNSHDIAMVELETPVEFNDYVRPACINTLQNEIEAYPSCYASGWGALEGGTNRYPDILQDVQVPIFPLENCTVFYEGDFLINKYMVCAALAEGGKDSCQGDSGGPFVCQGTDNRWHLVGATSFGEGCAEPGHPGVYARISQYLDFIQYHFNSDTLIPGKVIG